MSPQDLSVIHLADSEDDTVCRTQQSIAREISAGRDVVVVCEGQRLMREERLMLARPAMASTHLACEFETGRVAIVHAGCEHVEEHLPPHLSEAVQFFASLDGAMKWLRPASENLLSSTLRYFALPAC